MTLSRGWWCWGGGMSMSVGGSRQLAIISYVVRCDSHAATLGLRKLTLSVGVTVLFRLHQAPVETDFLDVT